MNRRTIIATTGAMFGGLALAGCSTNSISEQVRQVRSDLAITDQDSQTTTFGNVEITVRVHNSGEARGSKELHAQVDVQGGDTYHKSRSITVSPGDYNDYHFEFDIEASGPLSGASYTYEAWLE